MSLRDSTFIMRWGRGLLVASVVFILGSLAIAEIDDHVTPRKEVFYCWLLVFFNAYIGAFIANQALKRGVTGFYVWAFLINGFRIGLFLIALLSIVKWDVVNVRGFVLMTFFGYFAFLAAEIHGLQKHTIKSTKTPPRGHKDD